MESPRILVQLDSDAQPSVFDGVVAADAGVDHLFRHGGIVPEAVRDLVYGAMFTRGGEQLRHTALFVGGSDVAAGEQLVEEVKKCFFGPVRVSVMLDSNGSNTTAAAAVLAAAEHLDLAATKALVLAATGPVGARVVRLLARAGAEVRVASRNAARAGAVCEAVAARVDAARLTPVQVATDTELNSALNGVELVFAAGAAGVELLSEQARRDCGTLRVAIDLNAVPPLGIGGIEVHDRAKDYDGVTCYGAVGVGGTKMKIHRAAVARLFEANDLVLDAEEIFEIGQAVVGG
ncbi:MAG: bifunctional NADP-dependent methylenetetrahydromethanopterin dehydrogenase/methylenetetrahydrofolate dehydrogenase [Planctomycetota bacterium]|nr:MAG: bifunctional NADP-dependent methylenetetrahydromethanopterin dehydrogenase/methylenetetrahydrofolate dehydrogenase [Planctomycetota bacterium]REK47987.1 MAG: bifunctional NADP-dependent methylenetetrahydromethanopterin dehydrogenase/methylenetetrahydrofolate dehydrogenase [Planctomycetota bacterium]